MANLLDCLKRALAHRSRQRCEAGRRSIATVGLAACGGAKVVVRDRD